MLGGRGGRGQWGKKGDSGSTLNNKELKTKTKNSQLLMSSTLGGRMDPSPRSSV